MRVRVRASETDRAVIEERTSVECAVTREMYQALTFLILINRSSPTRRDREMEEELEEKKIHIASRL